MREGHQTVRPQRGRGLRVACTFVVVLGASMAVSSPAWADLEGCSGSATSKDADGEVIDQATASNGKVVDEDGNEVFTASNPFEVDNDGVVEYDGHTDSVITDHTWALKILGIEVASGGSDNASGTTDSKDTFDLSEELPFPITGLVKVDGDLTGKGGSCTGSGYVKVSGNPLTSPLTWVGLVFTGLGALGIVLALPRVRGPKGVA